MFVHVKHVVTKKYHSVLHGHVTEYYKDHWSNLSDCDILLPGIYSKGRFRVSVDEYSRIHPIFSLQLFVEIYQSLSAVL